MFKDLKFCKDCMFVKLENGEYVCKHRYALIQNHKIPDLVTGEIVELKMTAKQMRNDRCGYDGVLFQTSD